VTKPARPRCAARSLRFTNRGLGKTFRIGRTKAQLRKSAGRQSKTRRRARYWCVKGGGTVRAIFNSRGRVVAVASTAKRHKAGKVARGVRLATLRRAYPRMTRIRRGMYVTRPGSRIVFGLRGGRVRYVAVATRSLARNAKSYRRHLGYGGV
jgi:hypothetical protein